MCGEGKNQTLGLLFGSPFYRLAVIYLFCDRVPPGVLLLYLCTTCYRRAQFAQMYLWLLKQTNDLSKKNNFTVIS